MLPKLDLFHFLIFNLTFLNFLATLNITDPSIWIFHHSNIQREISVWEVHIFSNLKGKFHLMSMGSKVREICEWYDPDLAIKERLQLYEDIHSKEMKALSKKT